MSTDDAVPIDHADCCALCSALNVAMARLKAIRLNCISLAGMRLLSFLVLVCVSSSAFAMTDQQLDEMAVELESARLKKVPGGFANYFWSFAIPILQNTKEDVDLVRLERAFRRMNTGFFLLAAPPNQKAQDDCIKIIPFKGRRPDLKYWAFLVGTGKSEADGLKLEFGIDSEETNIDRLRDAGIRMKTCSRTEN